MFVRCSFSFHGKEHRGDCCTIYMYNLALKAEYQEHPRFVSKYCLHGILQALYHFVSCGGHFSGTSVDAVLSAMPNCHFLASPNFASIIKHGALETPKQDTNPSRRTSSTVVIPFFVIWSLFSDLYGKEIFSFIKHRLTRRRGQSLMRTKRKFSTPWFQFS